MGVKLPLCIVVTILEYCNVFRSEVEYKIVCYISWLCTSFTSVIGVIVRVNQVLQNIDVTQRIDCRELTIKFRFKRV